MRYVGGVAAAFFLAAGCMFGAGRATADAAAEKEHFDRYLLFSGFDLWRSGSSAHGGLLWSPNGLAQEGFTLKLLVAGGLYRYHSDATPIDGAYVLTSVMPGWRFKRDRLEVTVFAGPDFQYHELNPDDLSNRTRGSHLGLRVGVDAWHQPSGTFMATGSVSASTIGPNYWSRAAIGWYVYDRVWVGPEAMALGGNKYQQFRAGVHVTGFRTKDFEWSGSFGVARDSDKRDGLYARFGMLTRR